MHINMYNIFNTIFFVQIVKEHNIVNATAYLLERNGDVQGAFNVLFEVKYHIISY